MTNEDIVSAKSSMRPRIVLSGEDYDRLSALANAAMNRMPDLAARLVEEIDRAHVLAKGTHLEQIVCMNSKVEFRDDSNGKIQKVTLVYPDEADISQLKISVLTPVGTALIGLRKGDAITWETPAGETRQLTVLAIQEHHVPSDA